MFLMPLVSFQSIKGNLLRLLPMKNEQEALPLHICSICTSTKIHVPYQTNCGHIYWFFFFFFFFFLFFFVFEN